MLPLLRIGTRASKLARAQAEMVRAALSLHFPELRLEIVPMTTAGDRDLHKQMSDWGYKGLFTKELEDALLAGHIDIAVHSMKDMPSLLPEGLRLGAMLPRADVRDAWISPRYPSIETLPHGATVGTSSTRRAAQLRHWRPDVTITDFRGNVQTRLRKLQEGVAEATFLAAAGLVRLGLAHQISALLPTDRFLPAVAQGAVGIEYVEARAELQPYLAKLNDLPTTLCVTAERAMLLVLDGSCRTPIAGLAELSGEILHLRGEVLSLDGRIRYFEEVTGKACDAEKLGHDLGQCLRGRAGDALLNHA